LFEHGTTLNDLGQHMIQAHQVGHAVGHGVDTDDCIARTVHQAVDQAGDDYTKGLLK
jgi:hypothetical protein